MVKVSRQALEETLSYVARLSQPSPSADVVEALRVALPVLKALAPRGMACYKVEQALTTTQPPDIAAAYEKAAQVAEGERIDLEGTFALEGYRSYNRGCEQAAKAIRALAEGEATYSSRTLPGGKRDPILESVNRAPSHQMKRRPSGIKLKSRK